MTSVNLNHATLPEATILSSAPRIANRTSAPSGIGAPPADSLRLSPAALGEIGLTGRVAMNQEAGTITSDQAQQLYGQVSSIHSQIVADKQAGGGTLSPIDAQAIQQLQSQLSQDIYAAAHNGAAPPPDAQVTRADARQALEAGRIALNLKAGNLTSDEASQLGSQLSAIHRQIVAEGQGDGGTPAPADAVSINQLQNQLSRQIYQEAHSTQQEG